MTMTSPHRLEIDLDSICDLVVVVVPTRYDRLDRWPGGLLDTHVKACRLAGAPQSNTQLAARSGLGEHPSKPHEDAPVYHEWWMGSYNWLVSVYRHFQHPGFGHPHNQFGNFLKISDDLNKGRDKFTTLHDPDTARNGSVWHGSQPI